MWIHDRRLTAALRSADRLKPGATDDEITAAVGQLIEDFVERWLGKKSDRVTRSHRNLR
jgi:hypothetical protein